MSLQKIHNNSSDTKDNNAARLIFPTGFFWGAATSSHQVEGGNFNDWSEWEKMNAERLAREAEAKFGYLQNWPEVICLSLINLS